MSKEFLAMINLDTVSGKSSSIFKNYLKEQGIEAYKAKMILEIFSLKVKTKKNYVRKFNKIVANFKENEKKNIGFDRIKENLTTIKELKGTMLGYLAEILIAVRSGNKFWGNALIADFMFLDNSNALFSLPNKGSSKKDRLELKQNVVKIFSEINSFFKDPFLMRLLITKVAILMPSAIIGSSISQFDGSWSLTEIRETVYSKNRKYLGFWFTQLLGRSTRNEWDTFLGNSLSLEKILSLKDDELWIFNFYFPKKDSHRTALLKRLNGLSKSKKFIDRYRIIELIKNKTLKDLLGKISPKFKRAHFNLERELYKDLLKDGRSVSFSLYNLISLGDKNDRLLWWLAI